MSKPSIFERAIMLIGAQVDSDTIRGGGKVNTTFDAEPDATAIARRAATAGPHLVPTSGEFAPFEQQMYPFPVSGSYNPLSLNSEIEELEEAQSDLSPSGVAVGRSTDEIAADFYVFGQGIVNLWPVWTQVFRFSGMQETRYASKDNPGDSIAVTTDATETLGDMAVGAYEYVYTMLLQSDGTTPATSMANAVFESMINDTPDSASIAAIGDANDVVLPSTGIKRAYRGKVGTTGGPYYFIGQVPSGTTTMTDRLNDSNITDLAPVDGNNAGPGGIDLNRIVWTPRQSGFEACTMVTCLDGRWYFSKGSRGNFSYAPDAGSFIKAAMAFQAVVQPNLKAANPSITRLAQFPARLCATDIKILRAGGVAAFVPVNTNISFQTGYEIRPRLDSNVSCDQFGVKEYTTNSKPDPRASFAIEFDEDQDFRADFFAHTRFMLAWKIGNGVGKTLQFHNNIDFAGGSIPSSGHLAQIISPPNFGESEGNRLQPLEFRLCGDGASDFYQIMSDNLT